MNDSDMLDWMHMHGKTIARHSRSIVLFWFDKNNEGRCTQGIDLRDCIRGAVAIQNNYTTEREKK